MPPRRPQQRRRTQEVPRWRRQPVQARGHPAGVSRRPRRAEKIAREMSAAQLLLSQQQPAAGQPAAGLLRLPRPAWRFRRHVQPFIWLGLLLAAAGLRAVPGAVRWGLLAGFAVPALMWLAAVQRHKDGRRIFGAWTRRFVAAEAACTGLWLPLLSWLPLRAVLPWLLVSWAPFAALWARRYRWRPAAAQKTVTPAQDAVIWAALCAEQKWNATLGRTGELAGGGRRYPVQCDGVKTVMKKILAVPDNVAGAWHSAVTEVYAERDPKGVTSRGYLTILPGSSLQGSSWWDGRGMDPATGLARIGRFADGSPAHVKLYTPRFGCRHDLDSGTTGSGKSELLNLKIFIALQTGWFVPVILDPQEGQSLPFWRDRCLYASGVSQVERRLRGLHAAFLDRSSMLSTWRWSDDGVDMPGMPFFDYALLGGQLPVAWIFLDEAHMVLKDGSKGQRQITAYVVELARLIRKAGGKMTLATHVPGLAELGGQHALRDMLRGGNVWSGRTANKVAGGMLGLVKDPSEIPRFFADGAETAGLGYADGPENRPDAPMRTDRVGRDHYRSPPPVPQLDDRFLEVMDAAMKDAVSPTATVAPAAAGTAGRKLHLVQAREEPPDDAPDGRRCVDAVWLILARSSGPVERGEVIVQAGEIAAEWGRAGPWTIKAVGNALRDLADGRVARCAVSQPVKGGPYQAVTGQAAEPVHR